MSENIRNSLLFGPSLDLGCGLQDIYILEWVMYALERFLHPSKTYAVCMGFDRFRQRSRGARTRAEP